MTSENVKRALQKAADRAARLAEADASSSRDPGADKEDVPKTDRKQAALDKAKEQSRTLVGVMYAYTTCDILQGISIIDMYQTNQS